MEFLNDNFREAEQELVHAFYNEYKQGYVRTMSLNKHLGFEYWGCGDQIFDIISQIMLDMSRTIPYEQIIETYLNIYNYMFDRDEANSLKLEDIKKYTYVSFEELVAANDTQLLDGKDDDEVKSIIED